MWSSVKTQIWIEKSVIFLQIRHQRPWKYLQNFPKSDSPNLFSHIQALHFVLNCDDAVMNEWQSPPGYAGWGRDVELQFHQMLCHVSSTCIVPPTHPEALWWTNSPGLPIKFYSQDASLPIHLTDLSPGEAWSDASGAGIGQIY